jgi:hypothetical protein
MYLLRDGLLVKVPTQGANIVLGGMPMAEEYVVTPAGQEFIERWVKAEPVAPNDEL